MCYNELVAFISSINQLSKNKGEPKMQYSKEVEEMICVAKGPNHGPAPIPEEGKWIQAKRIEDISGYTHGVGWCAPQQGACKLSLNVKNGVIEEALVETIGCSGMTHSAAMASEILPGKTILEALNTDLVCDAINTAMRELFLQTVYGRTSPRSLTTACASVRVWRIWARVCAPWSARCTAPRRRAPATSK